MRNCSVSGQVCRLFSVCLEQGAAVNTKSSHADVSKTLIHVHTIVKEVYRTQGRLLTRCSHREHEWTHSVNPLPATQDLFHTTLKPCFPFSTATLARLR